jgi:uncharacterized membrane protein
MEFPMRRYSLTRRPPLHAGPSGLLLLAAGVAASVVLYKLVAPGPLRKPNDAPRKALRRRGSGGFPEYAVVGRTVTINLPRQEVYRVWRDFGRFPEFMENVIEIIPRDERHARWRVSAPGGTEVEFETAITEDKPGELIAWRSVEGADIRNCGRIVFRDAPGNRGTEVEATIAYDPPGGTVGRLAAKLFQREPKIQARRELKRFKQLMETGEIAIAEAGPSAPRAQ